jgi:hypothetical protein
VPSSLGDRHQARLVTALALGERGDRRPDALHLEVGGAWRGSCGHVVSRPTTQPIATSTPEDRQGGPDVRSDRAQLRMGIREVAVGVPHGCNSSSPTR